MDQKELFGELPAIIKDPFHSKNIYHINMSAFYSEYFDEWRIDGLVKFRNDDTEGTQKFTAKTMGELYLKIQEFINSMK